MSKENDDQKRFLEEVARLEQQYKEERIKKAKTRFQALTPAEFDALTSFEQSELKREEHAYQMEHNPGYRKREEERLATEKRRQEVAQRELARQSQQATSHAPQTQSWQNFFDPNGHYYAESITNYGTATLFESWGLDGTLGIARRELSNNHEDMFCARFIVYTTVGGGKNLVYELRRDSPNGKLSFIPNPNLNGWQPKF